MSFLFNQFSEAQTRRFHPWPAIAALGFAAAILLNPQVPIQAAPMNSGDCSVVGKLVNWISDDVLGGTGTSISSNGFGQTTATWSDGYNKLKVKIDGEIEFGDDDRTISRLSKSGSVTIWQKRGSRTTMLTVNADRDGTLQYEFEIDGKEAVYDDQGRLWLAGVLVDVIRKTGIGAENRANRILDREGVDGLIDEIQFVESDYVIRIYLGTALERIELSPADCRDILEEAALSMDSDYEKAELLLTAARAHNVDATIITSYVDVAATMESDYEIRRALSAVEFDKQVDQAVVDAILQIAARMDSDYETAELLIAFAPQCHGSERLCDMYVRATSGIESDYEARRALMELDWHDGMPANAIIGALNVAGRMSSDYEAAELLCTLAPHSADDPEAVAAFMRAVEHVDSDYEAARSLARFSSSEELNSDAILAVLRAVGSISSSYEQSNVLRAVGRHCHDNGTLEDAYVDALDLVDSDHDRMSLYSDFFGRDRETRRARRGD
jgi:hypothetical protein